MNDNINEHSQIKAQAAIARLERFSKLTDSSIGIPFTKFNIGLEAVIGLIPVIGDAAGLILSSYVLIEAQRLGVSKRIKTKMIINMLIDFVGGLVPFFGDIFDAFFKANTRNTQLLKKHLNKQLSE
ncbi:DUF4112 domain-containing protein [Pseudoalteromonas sp. NZS127_1]|jgi:hypothetical protein|uniref:DUF4112 domain-containing protein n=2 Tax=Pseudoalteromonas TaxID=53246 RepID=A0A4P9J1N8_9GAMM|nr:MULTISPECIES: DUF4112 domain-containing protein [Pseudoalteromonas]KAA1159019.1 DUF4112 domain-containing protein [Pseudoalteromonas distincta]KHM50725.1 hypothetical protein PL71_01725 [Pseudoalteromonas elyakovii]KID34998.1 hypothetical protein QT16_15780 [Pseudoalteromonas distincta]MBA6411111.1 DUF4112 domain-containing protein [Pseudoalteromonas sp. 5Ae-yellow]MBB1277993.1 DUF4112 domain-containing protein [Pseudoalteromonas sp. SR43-3]|tara:strand:+ start:385 stop:762 length:378 start_codon:yes stop_codon:yes gene_type:complete